MKVKEESEKVGLKLNIWKTKIVASGPITSCQIDGKTVEDFIFLGSQITADGDCSHEIKRHLTPWKKSMTNLDSTLKSRDVTLPTKIHLVKAMVFPVVMYGCESWTVKKAECQRIDAFELWGWRRLLRVPWTARRCNQSILKEISPEFGIRMASPTQWTWVWVNSGSWVDRKACVLQSMGLQRVGHDWVTELNWAELRQEVTRGNAWEKKFFTSKNFIFQETLSRALRIVYNNLHSWRQAFILSNLSYTWEEIFLNDFKLGGKIISIKSCNISNPPPWTSPSSPQETPTCPAKTTLPNGKAVLQWISR